MKQAQVTISYDEKRSHNFQTAGFGVSLVITLDEGETAGQAIEKYRPALVKIVTETTLAEVQRLADEAPRKDR